MSDYINFQIGEKFPLPIKQQQDGGMFQIDANGIMFILQLSHNSSIFSWFFSKYGYLQHSSQIYRVISVLISSIAVSPLQKIFFSWIFLSSHFLPKFGSSL